MPSNLFAAAAAAAAAVVRIRLPTKPQNDDGYSSSSAYHRELFKRRETRRQGGREREETLTMFYKIERRRHDMIYDDAHDRNWTGGIFLFFSFLSRSNMWWAPSFACSPPLLLCVVAARMSCFNQLILIPSFLPSFLRLCFSLSFFWFFNLLFPPSLATAGCSRSSSAAGVVGCCCCATMTTRLLIEPTPSLKSGSIVSERVCVVCAVVRLELIEALPPLLLLLLILLLPVLVWGIIRDGVTGFASPFAI